MKNIYKEFLFSKGILVCEESNFHQLFTTNVAASYLAFASKLAIRIRKGKELCNINTFRYAQEQLGINVPLPFYRGFPDSVKNMTGAQLLFDQCVNYFYSYTLGIKSVDINQSVFEEKIERTYFHEKVKVRDFDILNEEDAFDKLKEYISDACAGSRALNDSLYSVVKEFAIDYQLVTARMNFGSKDLAIRLLSDTRFMGYQNNIDLPDFIKVVERIAYDGYGLIKINKLNLKNQDRKFLVGLLHGLMKNTNSNDIGYAIALIHERKKDWKGVLHHIHFKPINEKEVGILSGIRCDANLSFMAGFEEYMSMGDVLSASDYLDNKGPGTYLRHLDYMLSKCENEKERKEIIRGIPTYNGLVLMQLMLHYRDFYHGIPRSFVFTKFGVSKNYTESINDAKKRGTNLSEEDTEMMYNVIRKKVLHHYSGKLYTKVYIEPGMDRCTIPMYESCGFGGFGVLAKGSRIQIPKGKIIRAFTYWEKVDDIDLSILGLNEDGTVNEFSWRTIGSKYDSTKDAIQYSGDCTTGYDGGSEYFDIDVDNLKACFPNIRYFIFCDNVFSEKYFKNCVCRAGYMLRDGIGSGEIYEPATVQTAFTINCPSTDAYLFAIDAKTNEIVWLNIPRSGLNPIAGDDPDGAKSVKKYLDIVDTWNVELFAKTIAQQIVFNPADADVIFGQKYYILRDGQEQIKPNDFEKFAKLMEL